jgi:COMPASS component SWD3
MLRVVFSVEFGARPDNSSKNQPSAVKVFTMPKENRPDAIDTINRITSNKLLTRGVACLGLGGIWYWQPLPATTTPSLQFGEVAYSTGVNSPLALTLTGHSKLVSAVTFSPDGKMIASVSSDKSIKLWDSITGIEIRTLTGHKDEINAIAFSPDGKILASGSSDRTIKLWNTATGQLIYSLSGHMASVQSLAFANDGTTLVSGGWDQKIKIWDVKNGVAIRTIQGHCDIINSLAVATLPPESPLSGGKAREIIATANQFEGKIKLWDLQTGVRIYTLNGHDDTPVNALAVSADGKTLASAGWDKTVRLWNLDTGREIRTLIGHTNRVWSVAFSPDGKTLASAGWDKTVKIWNLETGAEMNTLQGHNNRIWSIAFSPDSKTLASGSFDRTIKLWHLMRE